VGGEMCHGVYCGDGTEFRLLTQLFDHDRDTKCDRKAKKALRNGLLANEAQWSLFIC
jgi:hypothetical protein